MQKHVDAFLEARDEIPQHYFLHMAHAFEIIAYKHPDSEIRGFFFGIYHRICNCFHMGLEEEEDMDDRLADKEQTWREMTDASDKPREGMPND